MSHKAFIERRRPGGGWVLVAADGLVQPLEAIRISSDAPVTFPAVGKVEMRLLDRTGAQIEAWNAASNLQGNAYLDISAPDIAGSYTLVVHAPNFKWGILLPGGGHEARATFRVDAKAPPPISAPEDGDILGDILDLPGEVAGTLRAAVPILLIVGGLIVLSQVKGILK